jgi:hypothetical protein
MTRRRPHARPVLALAGAAALALAGCGSSTAPAVAEIVDEGPECLATEVLQGLAIQPPEGHDRPAPAAGSVPADFDPVAVVECRGPLSEVEVWSEPGQLVVPELLEPEEDRVEPGGPGEVGLQPGEPGGPALPAPQEPAAPTPVTVTEVELHGDLAPLLADLARPSRTAGPDQACPAMMEYQPQIYLLDALGRAVRVQWPTDGCRFLLDGVTDGLTALTEVRRDARTLN